MELCSSPHRFLSHKKKKKYLLYSFVFALPWNRTFSKGKHAEMGVLFNVYFELSRYVKVD